MIFKKTYEYDYNYDGFPTICIENLDYGDKEITEFKYKN